MNVPIGHGSFGGRLKFARRVLAWSFADLSSCSGLDIRDLFALEADKRKCNEGDARKLAEVLRISPSWLRNGGQVFREGWYFVYRILGQGGEVLYVGATANLNLRMYQHSRSPVWESVGDVSYTFLEGELEAAKLEQSLILKYAPLHNRGNRKYRGPGPREDDPWTVPVVSVGNVAPKRR